VHALFLVLILDVLRSLSVFAESPEITADPGRFAWQPSKFERRPTPRPFCFAYSSSQRAYACLGYSVEESSRGLVRKGYVDVIGSLGQQKLVESHLVWRPTGVGLESQAEVDRRLDELGFSPDIPHAARLVPGRWTMAETTGVRYELRLHEGDASFEYFGDVTVRCPNQRWIPLHVRQRHLELGKDAWLFWVPGASVIAVSIHGEDGGEDISEHWLNTVVIDTEALCAGRSGIAGPFRNRSVGPWN
jgi:hypothetical protein